MIYKVSVLRGTKLNPEKVQVTEVMADRFTVPEVGRGLFDNASGVAFYNDSKSFFGGKMTSLVAFLPGTDWIVEQS